MIFNDPIILGFALLNCLMALSLYMTFACGLFSFAQIGFIAVGAYSTGIGVNKIGLHPIVAILFALGVTFVLALAVAIPMLRLRDIYLALLTFGFAEIMVVVARNMTDLTGGAQGMPIPRYVGNATLAIVLLVLMAGLWLWRRSLYGQAMDSIRQDETAAEALGIETRRYIIGIFLMSSLVAALAGSLYALHTFFISANDFSFELTLNLFLFVVVGGVFHWYGAPIGAFALTYVMQWMTPLVQWRQIVLGVLLTATILVAPGGLASVPVRRIVSRSSESIRRAMGNGRSPESKGSVSS